MTIGAQTIDATIKRSVYIKSMKKKDLVFSVKLQIKFGGGCSCSCCDRGKTKSTPSPKTKVWTWDWSLTKNLL